ncbi:MAG: type II toxin-antitoxin system RelE/ParE family toxin [Betaproteobacteria bacterium]|nr:type II toxin-antitoxin system RelE/ParE family toxin [Betaproteobacteria bacterium]
MTRIELAPEVFDDFDRFFEHIAQFDPGTAPQRIGQILDAIQILAHSPLSGRPVKDGKRELVIGRKTRGYLALYRDATEIDTVFILAVRAQRGGVQRSTKPQPVAPIAATNPDLACFSYNLPDTMKTQHWNTC